MDESTNAAPSDYEARLQSAARLADEGRWEDAYDLLHDLEDGHGEDPTLLCLLGSVSNELCAYDRAHDYFARTVAAQPADPLVLVTAGAALARWDDPQAEGALRLAALTAPDLALARLYYGVYLAREGILDQAISELEAAYRLDESEPRAGRELGVAHLLAGRLDAGIQWLEDSLAREEHDPETRLLLGLALVQAGRAEHAAEELHRAARELPEDGDAQLLAALACAGQGWDVESWRALALAEGAERPPDPELLGEVEDCIHAGAEEAEAFLQEQLAPSLLRDRLADRL